MTDKIQKALAKFSAKEKAIVKELVTQLLARDLIGMNIKKLQTKENIFRVRKGRIRIIFSFVGSHEIEILDIMRRDESTYRKY